MKCLVVDDEPIAMKGVANYVEQTPFLTLLETAQNAFEAVRFLEENQVDLIFLDINMPQLTGIDFLRTLDNPPMVIFVTANPNHALEGFELNVVDYLLKPLGYPKFFKAAKKAHELFLLRQKPTKTEQDSFFVKVNKELVKIKLDEILYVESLKDYVLIKTHNKDYIVYLTLTKVLENLPDSAFVQVHKSFIVSVDKIHKISGNQLVIKEKKIPIGRAYKAKAIAHITQNTLQK